MPKQKKVQLKKMSEICKLSGIKKYIRFYFYNCIHVRNLELC